MKKEKWHGQDNWVCQKPGCGYATMNEADARDHEQKATY